MKFIFGLGNPGEKYQDTRHNVGRYIVQKIGEEGDFSEWHYDKYLNAHIAEGELEGESMVLVLPDTYMNQSGLSVANVLKEWQGSNRDCVVVYDDIDLPLGEVRLAFKKGHGGHNGLKSVEHHLNGNDFIRIRVGIGHTGFFSDEVKRPATGGKLEKYVLGKFSIFEAGKVSAMVTKVKYRLEALVRDGLEKARSQLN